MKRIVRILCLVSIVFAQNEDSTTSPPVIESETTVFAAASSEPGIASESEAAKNDCDPWPSHLKPVGECCNVPTHFNALIQNICNSKCSLKHGESRNDCELVCYVNTTGLIQDEKINKAVVQRIYENNALHERQWSKIIHEGVEKCEYVTTGSLSGDLLKFYNCVNDYLSGNCVSFMQTNDCDASEEYYSKCKNIEPNCAVWPLHLMHPDACCKTIQLITEALNNKCRHQCQRKVLFYHRLHKCVHNCTHIETGLIADNKIDFGVVKKMLVESSNRSLQWEKPIEVAIEGCDKVVKGMEAQKMSDRSIQMHLQSCLQEHLSDNCGEYRAEPYCNKVKRFIDKCPETKPFRATMRYINISLH